MVLARTLDIGAEGAAVVADLNPGEAAPLAIKLRLPTRPQGSRLFEAPAHVVHAVLAGKEAGFRLSLQFGRLDAESKKALSGFLSREPVAGLSFVRW
jgi:hypothetical protein